MKFEMNIERPDDVEVTLHITMPLKEWTLLKRQLDSAYPSWKLSSIIDKIIERINKTIFENIPTQEV